jgi:hypothetical protein
MCCDNAIAQAAQAVGNKEPAGGPARWQRRGVGSVNMRFNSGMEYDSRIFKKV